MGIDYTFSPAEIGAIVSALEIAYPADSIELHSIAVPLCRAVYDKLSQFGDEYYDLWVQEFHLSDEAYWEI